MKKSIDRGSLLSGVERISKTKTKLLIEFPPDFYAMEFTNAMRAFGFALDRMTIAEVRQVWKNALNQILTGQPQIWPNNLWEKLALTPKELKTMEIPQPKEIVRNPRKKKAQ